MKPLLKWAGGKRRLLAEILPLIPQAFGRYYEPFMGGGALFFSLNPPRATLGDKNIELIECYKQVKHRPDSVIAELKRLKNDACSYYKTREARPSTEAAKAARFLYLSTLSFNGIYRQNLQGIFNVPYGFKEHLNPSEALPIAEASTALKGANLIADDFEKVVATARLGDLVYFDPPYTVAHSNNGFVKYNATIFRWSDQVRLSACAARLATLGCTVIISNADHPSIHELYPNYERITIRRQSVIAASSNFRKMTTECLFLHRTDS